MLRTRNDGTYVLRSRADGAAGMDMGIPISKNTDMKALASCIESQPAVTRRPPAAALL
jgi:hypothetical protein